MSFIVVGTNHKYSSIELRERLIFLKKRLKDALSFLKENSILKGGVILSTCNRIEIYASAKDLKQVGEEIEYFISRFHEIAKQDFSPYLYMYEGGQAIRHLFSVACGLDSLILGETQILEQVKFAFFEAKDANFVDKFLRVIFYSAISFAKRIHRETKISQGKVSVGSITVDFIKEKLGSLLDKNILIIGVGKVTELVLEYLKKEGPNVIFISNRTFERAKDLASQIGARAARFDELEKFLKNADVVITATASPHFIIKREMIEEIAEHRLLIVDLALPRDVDPQIKELRNVELFYFEDLNTVIKKNKEKRIQEAKKAEWLIDKEVQKLWSRMQNYGEEFLRDPEVLQKK